MTQDTGINHYEPFESNEAYSMVSASWVEPIFIGTQGPIQLRVPPNDLGGCSPLQLTTLYSSSNRLTAAPDVSTESSTPSSSSHPNLECSVCGKRFARKGRAESCENSHTGTKPYPCQGECGNINWYLASPRILK